MIDSLVTTIGIYDEVTAQKRSDGRICVHMSGEGCEDIPPEANNAVRAAELFVRTFGTGGADITVRKHIPVGAGLGGIPGVLLSVPIASVLYTLLRRDVHRRLDGPAKTERPDSPAD